MRDVLCAQGRCPGCKGGLRPAEGASVRCAECGLMFGLDGGIPRLYHPHDRPTGGDVTQEVQAFYEEHPFPGYEELDSPWSLRAKAQQGIFAQSLDDTISRDASVLEVGCGTGQLSNFLGLVKGRRVFGADLCAHSLTLAEHFRVQHRIGGVCFLQMNLFRPCFADGSFDAVVCNGVLHHTSEPRRGFESIARLVRPGGLIAIGLYNRVGRWSTDLRRELFRYGGEGLRWLDPRLRETDVGEGRKAAWFADQYMHPHESKHGYGEALSWLEGAGFTCLRFVPPPLLGTGLKRGGLLDTPQPLGNPLTRAAAEWKMAFTGGAEGGFFIVVGRRD